MMSQSPTDRLKTNGITTLHCTERQFPMRGYSLFVFVALGPVGKYVATLIPIYVKRNTPVVSCIICYINNIIY